MIFDFSPGIQPCFTRKLIPSVPGFAKNPDTRYLFRADQFFGETYYNLISEGNIKRNDFGVNVFAGAEYEFIEQASVYFRVNEAFGLMQLEKDASSGQTMYNRTFSVQFGCQFVISKAE